MDWLILKGWFDQATLSRFLSRPPGYETKNLCEYLQALGMLSAEQAQFALNAIKQQSAERRSGPSETPGQQLSRALSGYSFDTRLRGFSFAGYVIEGEVSRGSMGVVLKVNHPDYDRSLAMKILHGAYHDDVIYKRFLREARVLKDCDHPNIVRVYDFNVIDGVPFYVMELIEGQSLEVILREDLGQHGRVPDFDWTASVFEGVADALVYCHEAGLIHRDVKPGNIIVEQQSLRPILVDFGIVRRNKESKIGEGSRFETASTLTKTGEVHGTPAYMSPEQIEPEQFGQVTERADVWGFGATLFHVLTGIAPYEREGANIYLALLQKNPPRARSINPEVPAWLDRICHRCLQRTSAQRPEMNSVLKDLLSPNRAPRKSLTPFVLVFVLIVVLGTAGGVWAFLAAEQEELAERHQKVHAEVKSTYSALLSDFEKVTVDSGESAKGEVEDLIERARALEELQIRDGALAERMGGAHESVSGPSLKELRRSLRAFSLAEQFRRGELDPKTLSSEKAVRLLKNESPTPNDFVQWASALQLKKAGRSDEALRVLESLRSSSSLGSRALRELAELQFQLKNWSAADALTEQILEAKGASKQRLRLILRRALIQIRLKNKAVARVFLKSAQGELIHKSEDRENALRLALFLGEQECFGRFLEGSSEQEKRKPYAAIAIVWHELAQGHKGEARHRLRFLPKDHPKRFLRAHSFLARALVQREFFELSNSEISIGQALELNKSSGNILMQLYCARVRISNLMTGDELDSAMEALQSLEDSLPAKLDDIQTGILADINRRVADVARFQYLLDVSETGRHYMSYYKRSLALSKNQEVLTRLAIIAFLRDQPDEAKKLMKEMAGVDQSHWSAALLKAHKSWPTERSSAKDPALRRSLENFAKARERLRSPALERMQRDMECRLQLSIEKAGSLDTVLIQKYVNRCSEFNALEPKTAYLSWRLASSLGFPGADLSARRLSFHLDPSYCENWETYALIKGDAKIPSLDFVIAFDRDRNSSRLQHKNSLVRAALALRQNGQSQRALYYARILFERDPTFLPNLYLLRDLLQGGANSFEKSKVKRALENTLSRGEETLKAAQDAYRKGLREQSIKLCRDSLGYLSMERHSLRDKILGHSLIQGSSSASPIEGYHVLARAALKDLEATALLFDECFSFASASKHKDLATVDFESAPKSPLDRRAGRLRRLYHEYVAYLGRGGDKASLRRLRTELDSLLHSHPASTGLRLLEACLLLSQGYAFDAVIALDLVVLQAKRSPAPIKCFVYSIAAILHRACGQEKVAKEYDKRVESFQSKDARLKGRSLFLQRLEKSFPRKIKPS